MHSKFTEKESPDVRSQQPLLVLQSCLSAVLQSCLSIYSKHFNFSSCPTFFNRWQCTGSLLVLYSSHPKSPAMVPHGVYLQSCLMKSRWTNIRSKNDSVSFLLRLSWSSVLCDFTPFAIPITIRFIIVFN